MTTSLVLTVLGDDRPGLVETLAKAVAEHNANWLDSRMAHLAGKFAGIVHIEASEKSAGRVLEALQALNSERLHVVVERSGKSAAPAAAVDLRLDLVGSDHPGIVHDISRALARRKVSIEDFTSGTDSASMAGGKLFRASARVRVPRSVDLSALQEELEELANDLMVDISLNGDEAG